MTTLIATIALTMLIFLLLIAGMSVGVLNGRKPISGSCGGVGGKGCELCSRKRHGRCPRGTGEQA